VFMNMVDIDFHLAQIAKLMSSLRWWIPLISYFEENTITRILPKFWKSSRTTSSFLLQQFFFGKKTQQTISFIFLSKPKDLFLDLRYILFLLDPAIAKKFTLSAPPTMRLIVAFIDRRSSFQFR
jgi:hypothetical protein